MIFILLKLAFSSLFITHLYCKFVFGAVDSQPPPLLAPGLLGSPSRNWGPHNSLDLSWLSPEKFGTCYIYWCYNREIYKQLLNAFLSIFRFVNLLFYGFGTIILFLVFLFLFLDFKRWHKAKTSCHTNNILWTPHIFFYKFWTPHKMNKKSEDKKWKYPHI